MDFLNLGINIITIIITIIVLIVAIVYINKHSSSISKLETSVSSNKKEIDTNKSAISQIPTYTLNKLINELSEDDISALLLLIDGEKVNKGMDKLSKDDFLKFNSQLQIINNHLDELQKKHKKDEQKKEEEKKTSEESGNESSDKPTEEPKEPEKPEEPKTEKFTLMYPANSTHIQRVNYLI